VGELSCYGLVCGLADCTVRSNDVVDVPPVVSVSVGTRTVCAVFKYGGARCWGTNTDSSNSNANLAWAVGYGTGLGKITPFSRGDPSLILDLPLGEQLGGNLTQVTSITTTQDRTCITTGERRVRCWGTGQDDLWLGYGTGIRTIAAASSAPDNDFLANVVTHVRVGPTRTCLLLFFNQVRCFGSNRDQLLGYTNVNDDALGDNEESGSAGSLFIDAALFKVDVGNEHACAAAWDQRSVYCWGAPENLRLGRASLLTRVLAPTAIGVYLRVDSDIIDIKCGGAHSCVLLANGKIICWGMNGFGQLGYGVNPTDKAGNLTNLPDRALSNEVGFSFPPPPPLFFFLFLSSSFSSSSSSSSILPPPLSQFSCFPVSLFSLLPALHIGRSSLLSSGRCSSCHLLFSPLPHWNKFHVVFVSFPFFSVRTNDASG
jgi:Regulator of chromosome condensation (RCC1) repeat